MHNMEEVGRGRQIQQDRNIERHQLTADSSRQSGILRRNKTVSRLAHIQITQAVRQLFGNYSHSALGHWIDGAVALVTIVIQHWD